ncbi:MAG: AAA family ATPase [Candidatus Falkowbacteria bacterium]|nr:AAA family ATPase [Candidatus Falkowbacteria bacterium]
MGIFFNRYITDKLITGFKRSQIIILIGSRQVGKTYISRNFIKNYLNKKEKGLYYNFENFSDLEAWQSIEHNATL